MVATPTDTFSQQAVKIVAYIVAIVLVGPTHAKLVLSGDVIQEEGEA